MAIQTLSDVLAQRGAQADESQLRQIQGASGLAGLMEMMQKRKREEELLAQGQQFAGQFGGNDQGSQALKFLASQPGGAQIVAKLLAEQKLTQDANLAEGNRLQSMFPKTTQGPQPLQAVAPIQGQPLGNVINPQTEAAGITDPAQLQALQQVMDAEKQGIPAKASVAPQQFPTSTPRLTYEQAQAYAGSSNKIYADIGKRAMDFYDKKEARDTNREDQQSFIKSQSEQAALDRAALARSIADNRPDPAPTVLTDAAGNVKLVDRGGNLIKDLGNVGKPTATFEKAKASQKKLAGELSTAIRELTEITKDGGLIDQSTGSGAGAAVDWGASLVGKATPGSIAVGQLKPIYDLVLKMVPRFEGPQSDKDTASYEKAAGQIANPNIPNDTKKAAAKEILRLMKDRNNKFISKDIAGTEFESSVEPLTAATAPTQDKNAPQNGYSSFKTNWEKLVKAGKLKEAKQLESMAREDGLLK